MMKTVKLSTLGELKNGLNFGVTEILNPCKIISVADFKDNSVPEYETLGFVDSSVVSDDFLLKEGDILFVRSNGNKNLVGRIMLIKHLNEKITFSGFCIRFRPNDNIDPSYLFYALKSTYCKSQYSYSQQTNITNLSQDILDDVNIPYFSLDEQKNIASVLSKIDEKISLNKKIINELENLGICIFDCTFKELYENRIDEAHRIGEYVNSYIGKQYAGFANSDGKFRFFSCSKDIQWCKNFEFSGQSLIVSTHGDFHVEHYSGEFNAYFCNSIFQPKSKEYYGLLYFAMKKQMELLQRKSAGSVIKFISNEDICNLPIFVDCKECILLEFNRIIDAIEKMEKENIELNKTLQFLINPMVYGQATIKQ